MGSLEVDQELGANREGEVENQVVNSKQLRLRRAVSDVHFKAKLAPVFPGKKVRLSAYSSLNTVKI